jgi:hypothetical protein
VHALEVGERPLQPHAHVLQPLYLRATSPQPSCTPACDPSLQPQPATPACNPTRSRWTRWPTGWRSFASRRS